MAKYSKLKRIYFENNISSGDTIEITGTKLAHLKNVLRARVGEKFRIFNPTDGEYFIETTEISNKLIKCKVLEQFRNNINDNNQNLTLAIGIIKQEKLIETIRAAVQLGVTKIIPVIMDNSQNITSSKLNKERLNKERLNKERLNKERITKCIIETCEQCESLIIPSLTTEITLNQLLQKTESAKSAKNSEHTENTENSWIFFADEEADNTQLLNDTKNNINKIQPLTEKIILIGPEGGFSNQERAKLLELSNITRLSLGQNVLRTEIAAIAAISIVKHFIS